MSLLLRASFKYMRKNIFLIQNLKELNEGNLFYKRSVLQFLWNQLGFKLGIRYDCYFYTVRACIDNFFF